MPGKKPKKIRRLEVNPLKLKTRKRFNPNEPVRLIVNPADVQALTGCSDRTARQTIQEVKEFLGKKRENTSPCMSFVRSKGWT